jgi:signal transduction histidine kinase
MAHQDPLRDIRHSLHELAQPLAAVTGLVDLLLLDRQLDAEIFEDIRMISEKLDQVLEIISRIREIVRAHTQALEEEALTQTAHALSEHP